MSRLPAVWILTVLILSVCLFDQCYVNQTVKEMDAHIEQCRLAAAAGDMQTAETLIAQTNQVWGRRRKVLAAMIEQSVLDEVDDQLLYTGSMTRYHPEETVPALIQCRCMIREINYQERMSITSFF